MELQQNVPWWVTALLLLTVCTKCQLGQHYGHTATDRRPHTWSHQHHIQGGVVQQQVAEPTMPPLRPAVVVRCYADFLEVVVQADLFDAGIRVDGRHLQLGAFSEGDACKAAQSGDSEFTIQALLMDCGNKHSSTAENIIYSNVLVYAPEPDSDNILRLDGASIPVECRYEKKYTVDSGALRPTWIPFAAVVKAEDHVEFSLKLMTEDWHFRRGSNSYFLGDPIHLEASAILSHHTPLSVFVDYCSATPSPNGDDALRYEFIKDHGCLADAYLTGSSSRFLPRVEDHKLRLKLDAFKFYQEASDLIYITCHLRAVPTEVAVSSQNRACSFINNSWQSISGNDQLCQSCGSSDIKGPEIPEPPTTAAPSTTTAQTAARGPVAWRKSPHNPVSFVRVRPSVKTTPPQPRYTGMKKRETDATAEWTKTIHLEPVVILPSRDVKSHPQGPCVGLEMLKR